MDPNYTKPFYLNNLRFGGSASLQFGIFEIILLRDARNNDLVMAILAKDGRRLGLDKIRGWFSSRKSENDVFSLFRTLPSKRFLLETFTTLHNDFAEDWKKASSELASLPRLKYFFLCPDFESLKGNSRKKAVVEVFCGDEDLRCMDMLRSFGFTQKTNDGTTCWSFFGDGVRLALLDIVLRTWSKKQETLFLSDHFSSDVLDIVQEDAVTWLINRVKSGWRGGLLSGEFNSGKTRAALAFMSEMVSQEVSGSAVVIAPKSTIESGDGWLSQSEMFHSVFGDPFLFLSGTKELDTRSRLILTNYEILVRSPLHCLQLAEMISSQKSVLCFDEAIKTGSRNSASFFHSLALSMSGSFTVAISSSPIVNGIENMHSILSIADPSSYPLDEFEENHSSEQKKYESGRLFESCKTVKSVIVRKKKRYKNPELFRERANEHFIRLESSPSMLFKIDEYLMSVEIPEESVEKHMIDILHKSIDSFSQEEKDRISNSVAMYSRIILDDPISFLLQIRNKKTKKTKPLSMRFYDVLLQNQYGVPGEYVSLKSLRLVEEIIKFFEEKKRPSKIIVYTSYRNIAQNLGRILRNMLDESLHVHCASGLEGRDSRDASAGNFEKTGGVLISTDVFARGINFNGVEGIVHYGLPLRPEPEVFKQRNGRILRGSLPENASGKILYLISDHEEETRWIGMMKGKEWISRIACGKNHIR